MNCGKCKLFNKCPRWKKEVEYYRYIYHSTDKCKEFKKKKR